MKFTPTDIPDVITIEAEVFEDGRGFFLETYQTRTFEAAGIEAVFVQENLSGSHRGTLRGLHYQIRQPQGKLVGVVSGEIFDVALDIRRSSPTFGKWTGSYLSAKNREQLWIPPGFAHGYYAVSDWAEIRYMTTDYYAPQWERTILWNDPGIGIEWPLIDGNQPEVSHKDALGTSFSDAELFV